MKLVGWGGGGNTSEAPNLGVNQTLVSGLCDRDRDHAA